MLKNDHGRNRKIESRKLNVMCFNIPESKRSDVKERQNEDKDFLSIC